MFLLDAIDGDNFSVPVHFSRPEVVNPRCYQSMLTMLQLVRSNKT